MKLNEEGFVAIDIRIGRLGKVDDYFKKYPDRLNQKIFLSDEFGAPKNHSALELAVVFGHQSVLRWLVKKGAVETPQSSPNLLIFAVNQQNEEMIKTLSLLGFNPWKQTEIGVCPMSLAVSLGWDRGLSVWRQEGVSLKKRTPSGGNLFHDLVEKSHNLPEKQLLHLCNYLFECGVKWTKDKNGRLPLELASASLPKQTRTAIFELVQRYEAKAAKSKLTKVLASGPTKEVSPKKNRYI